jgi:hypothetical protein
MAPDPHQGGRLEDMAKDGTTIPGDAGIMNVVSFTAKTGTIYHYKHMFTNWDLGVTCRSSRSDSYKPRTCSG